MFVMQSLTLWREIANDMFRLWYLAEDDLLRSGNEYEQRDTGQGLQRVQNAPRTSRAMHQLLHSTQQRSGNWVGSSLIHLGDSNVPNALMFIVSAQSPPNPGIGFPALLNCQPAERFEPPCLARRTSTLRWSIFSTRCSPP